MRFDEIACYFRLAKSFEGDLSRAVHVKGPVRLTNDEEQGAAL